MPRKLRGLVLGAAVGLGSSWGSGVRTGPVPASAVREDVVRDAFDPEVR
ncbi:hypothetical protein [Streptomyces cupreus]|uniref:Uncharacterized protein n=1 Tax=Streptomyces cupreus TaxID=2759956 RepID=A0A7X1IY63_9ACTN|nr:hypothetical protein [Streptomyces cupreus]MBC2900693.1 hypothetical protein [Streptomyces cupreus]